MVSRLGSPLLAVVLGAQGISGQAWRPIGSVAQPPLTEPSGLYIEATYPLVDRFSFSTPNPTWVSVDGMLLLWLFDGRIKKDQRVPAVKGRWSVDDTSIAVVEDDSIAPRLRPKRPGFVVVRGRPVYAAGATEETTLGVNVTAAVRRAVVLALDTMYSVGQAGRFRVATFDWGGREISGVPVYLSARAGGSETGADRGTSSADGAQILRVDFDAPGRHLLVGSAFLYGRRDTIVVFVQPRKPK
jgi:hypothetical protein